MNPDDTLMRRKIAPRENPAASGKAGGVPRPERLWARAVAHGLSRAIDLDAVVQSARLGRCHSESVADHVGEGDLVVLLDGPDGYGVAILDPGLLSSMLEMQTVGRVLARPVGARPLTATDAAMIADPLDRVLAAQETLASELSIEGMPRGYRFATRVDDPRELALTLPDRTLALVALELRLGGGARSGRLTLTLPPPSPPKVEEPAEDGPSKWHRNLEARLMSSEVTLRAELARLRLSIAELSDLQVGDLLPVPREAIGTVRLIGPGGTAVSSGRLGQVGGAKALRLETPPEAPADGFAPPDLPSRMPDRPAALPMPEMFDELPGRVD